MSVVMERHHYEHKAVHLTVREEFYLSVNLSEAVPLLRSNHHLATDVMNILQGDMSAKEMLSI